LKKEKDVKRKRRDSKKGRKRQTGRKGKRRTASIVHVGYFIKELISSSTMNPSWRGAMRKWGKKCYRFEVLTDVTMSRSVFCAVTPCRPERAAGGSTCRLLLLGFLFPPSS
jgi:hypothetical protein